MLMWLASAAGCPVSLDGGDAATVESYRLEQAVRMRGEFVEKSRPALGFDLGVTTRDQVLAQLGGAASCDWSRERTVLRCVDQGVRIAAGVPIADLFIQFNLDGVLVAVDAMHEEVGAVRALARLDERQTQLDAAVGPLTARTGVSDSAQLAGSNLRRSAIEYRYRNYLARISATNFGDRGVRVREQYQWISPAIDG